jgi:hypothetical protein
MRNYRFNDLMTMNFDKFAAAVQHTITSGQRSDVEIADIVMRLTYFAEQCFETQYAGKKINVYQWMSIRKSFEASESGDWETCRRVLETFFEFETPDTIQDFSLCVFPLGYLKQWERILKETGLTRITAKLFGEMVKDSINAIESIKPSGFDIEME